MQMEERRYGFESNQVTNLLHCKHHEAEKRFWKRVEAKPETVQITSLMDNLIKSGLPQHRR